MSPQQRTFQTHRRTVRIVKPWSASRTTAITLLVVSTVALVFFSMWRFLRAEPPPLALHRTLGDISFTWKCEAGHVFSAGGQAGPRACIKCDRPAYPIDTHYQCPVHGPFEVAVRFAVDHRDVPHVSELRVVGSEWVFAKNGVLCPRCGRRLVRLRRDPLAGVIQRKAKRSR